MHGCITYVRGWAISILSNLEFFDKLATKIKIKLILWSVAKGVIDRRPAAASQFF